MPLKLKQCENCKVLQACKKSGHPCDKFDLYGAEPGPRPKKEKARCAGCYDDFYNKEGKERSMTGKGCVSYPTATIELKSWPFHINHAPPWQLRWQMSCYKRQWR